MTDTKRKWLWIFLFLFPILAVPIAMQENNITTANTIPIKIVKDTVKITLPSDDFKKYLYVIRVLEADLNYKARRTGSEYIGAYQVGNDARTSIGLSHMNNEGAYQIMLKDSTLQDIIVVKYIQDNIREMTPYFKKYNNTKVGRWFVTNSGILAMCHLLGVQSAKNFLDSHGTKIVKDGNGRPITDYLQVNNFNIYVDSILNDTYVTRVLASNNFSRPLK